MLYELVTYAGAHTLVPVLCPCVEARSCFKYHESPICPIDRSVWYSRSIDLEVNVHFREISSDSAQDASADTRG